MNAFYEGMAEILEIDIENISPEFKLHSSETTWDSLAIVSTIALGDDCFNVILNGKSLSMCQTISDIEKLITQTKQ